MKSGLILLIAIIWSILLIAACKKKDDNSLTTLVTVPPGPPSFTGNINGTDITFTTFSYSIDTARLNINAKSDNYESLNFILKPPRTKGSYKIDNYLNRALFNTISVLVQGKTGTVNISGIEDNLISGDFSFSSGSTDIKGTFVNIPEK